MASQRNTETLMALIILQIFWWVHARHYYILTRKGMKEEGGTSFGPYQDMPLDRVWSFGGFSVPRLS